MHPNPAFQHGSREAHEALIHRVGFGMVFLTTPDGPRVAHTPLYSTGNGAVRFHIARGNAIARHLDGAQALVVINGPEAYVSARWYAEPDQVSTWNYVALEMEGTVRAIDDDALAELLENLTDRHEARTKGGIPWTMDKLTPAHRQKLMRAIIGFEMSVTEWRGTTKLSQNKSQTERDRLIAGLEHQGASAMAELMRDHAE